MRDDDERSQAIEQTQQECQRHDDSSGVCQAWDLSAIK
jgi:hypothetical protein